MPDITTLRNILVSLQGHFARQAEIGELESQNGSEDVTEISRLQNETQIKEIIESERATLSRLTADLSTLEDVLTKKLSQEEVAVVCECINLVADLGSCKALRSEEKPTHNLKWQQRASDMLVVLMAKSSDSPSVLESVDKLITYLGSSGVLIDFFVNRLPENLQAEVKTANAFPPETSTLVKYRCARSESFSKGMVRAIRGIILQLSKVEGRTAEAAELETVVVEKEFSWLESARGMTDEIADAQLVIDLLSKHSKRILAQEGVTKDKLRLVTVLQRAASQYTIAAAATDSLRDEIGNSITDDRLEDWHISALAGSAIELTALMYLVLTHKSLKDEQRTRYYAARYTDNYVYGEEKWREAGFTLPWSPDEKSLIERLSTEFSEQLRQPSKVFEQLTVAQLTAIDATSLKAAINDIPQRVSKELLSRQLLPEQTPANAEILLKDQLGSIWRGLKDESQKALITGYILLQLPQELDHSASIMLFWKALEVELRERVFRAFWLRRLPTSSSPRTEYIEGVLVRCMLEREWEVAKKSLTLKCMLTLLQKAMEDNRRIPEYGTLRAHLRDQHPSLLQSPEALGLGTLITHAEEIRNNAVHSQRMSKTDAESSKQQVIRSLVALFPLQPV